MEKNLRLTLTQYLTFLTSLFKITSIILLVEKKSKTNPTVTNVLMAFFGVYILAVGQQIESLRGIIDGPWLLPFGIIGTNDFYMADYMALIPWLGVFLVGTVVGRVCYASRKSLITSDAKIFRKISKPFEFLGRHSLIIYIVHQPILLALIYVIVEFIIKNKLRLEFNDKYFSINFWNNT